MRVLIFRIRRVTVRVWTSHKPTRRERASIRTALVERPARTGAKQMLRNTVMCGNSE